MCLLMLTFPVFPVRIDEDNCVYYIIWETRAACAVKPQEVEIVNGMVVNPATGKNFSLGEIYNK